MKKILSFFAAMLAAVAVSATPVALPATLDVSNVSFRSEGMPDFVIEAGQDYAGTYFDMGAHDSSNDTLLYAEWDVTIESINYNVAVDVYNTNSWRVQLYVLNQAGDTVKALRYKGSSGQKGQYAIGSIDMRDLAAGNYKVRAHAATAWSAMKLKDVIFEADYQGVSVALPGTLLPAYAELSAGASVTNHAIAFAPSTAPDEYATWNVSFAAAGSFNVSIDITASNGHTYGVALLSADGQTEVGAVAEAQSWDTGVKELGAIAVPAAGSYVVKLTNATQWSEAVLNSITFAAPYEPAMKTIYCKMDKAWWKADGAAVGCYTWDDGGNPKAAWPGERMTPVEGETDLWSIELDINTYHMCIFTRMNPVDGDNQDWGAKTTNLTIPTDENDMFTITNDDPSWGDPGCTGAWSKYGEVVPEPKFRIAGSMSEEWAPSIESFEDSYTLHLAAGTHRLKVVTLENAWKGYTDLTEANKAAEIFTDQSGNICFVLAAEGDVVVTYTNELYKVEGAFIPAPVQLIGIGGWDAETYAIALTPAEDHLTASVTLNLDEWYYEFKMIVAGAWLGKENAEGLYGLHREWTSVDGLTYEGGNIKLTMDAQDIVPGSYTFTWEYATGKLTVTFPTPAPTGITWELNGGAVLPKGCDTNEELWEAFKPDYNAFYSVTRADQPIANVATFITDAIGSSSMMKSETAGWKWLGDYVIYVCGHQGEDSWDLTAGSEAQWRWVLDSFFNKRDRTTWPMGSSHAIFTEAGKEEHWLAAYAEMVLPESVSAEYTLPAAYKEGVEFGGWFDNAEFNGEALTVIPANYAGTLYAKWVSPSTNIENTAAAVKAIKVIENGQMIIIRGNEKFNVQGQVIR